MVKKLFIIIACFTGINYLSAQDVGLSAPSLSGREAKLYYFAGAKTDSLATTIDASGKAAFKIPAGNYRGMAIITVHDAGGIEFVVAEPYVEVKCNGDNFSFENMNFNRSIENRFLNHIFTSQSRYLQKQAWLQAGNAFLAADSPVLSAVKSELKSVEDSMALLSNEVTASKLYASKYFRLSEYMNRLFAAEQKRDTIGALTIRQEMEENLDIASLYTSGQLWNSVLNFYASLFNHTVGEDLQQQYATTVLRTSHRLPAPYFEAYISGCITEAERFGWKQAEDSILSKLLTTRPEFTATSDILQRAIGAYLAKNNKAMPEIIGLSEADKIKNSKPLIAFYDSDCSTCVNEMFRLTTIYPQLQEKNIRVVSIAGDMEKELYEKGIKDFPWQDKLCDFKGITGANFSNYNVVGTPSFFLIDGNRKLLGQFYAVGDLQKMINEL